MVTGKKKVANAGSKSCIVSLLPQYEVLKIVLKQKAHKESRGDFKMRSTSSNSLILFIATYPENKDSLELVDVEFRKTILMPETTNSLFFQQKC